MKTYKKVYYFFTLTTIIITIIKNWVNLTTTIKTNFSSQQMETITENYTNQNRVMEPCPGRYIYNPTPLWRLKQHCGRGVERLQEPEEQRVCSKMSFLGMADAIFIVSPSPLIEDMNLKKSKNGVYVRVWREKREGRNYIIIISKIKKISKIASWPLG